MPEQAQVAVQAVALNHFALQHIPIAFVGQHIGEFLLQLFDLRIDPHITFDHISIYLLLAVGRELQLSLQYVHVSSNIQNSLLGSHLGLSPHGGAGGSTPC